MHSQLENRASVLKYMRTMTLSSPASLSCQSAVYAPISASSLRVVQAMCHGDSLYGLLHRAQERRSMDQISRASSTTVVAQPPQNRRKAATLLEQQAQKQYLSQVIMEALMITADK